MHRIADGIYRHKGFTVSRGAYMHTPDDRIDRWYIDYHDSQCWDRRGRGYRTLADAKLRIDTWLKEEAPR